MGMDEWRRRVKEEEEEEEEVQTCPCSSQISRSYYKPQSLFLRREGVEI